MSDQRFSTWRGGELTDAADPYKRLKDSQPVVHELAPAGYVEPDHVTGERVPGLECARENSLLLRGSWRSRVSRAWGRVAEFFSFDVAAGTDVVEQNDVGFVPSDGVSCYACGRGISRRLAPGWRECINQQCRNRWQTDALTYAEQTAVEAGETITSLHTVAQDVLPIRGYAPGVQPPLCTNPDCTSPNSMHLLPGGIERCAHCGHQGGKPVVYEGLRPSTALRDETPGGAFTWFANMENYSRSRGG